MTNEGRAFAHHKTVAIAVKRAARRLGILYSLAQRPHHVERRHHDRENRRLSAACHHHVGIAAAQQFERLATGRGAAGAGTHYGMVGPLQVVVNGELACRTVHQHVGDHKRADLAQTLGRHRFHVLDKRVETANAASDHGAHAFRLFVFHVEAGIGEHLLGRGNRILDTGIKPSCFFAIHVIARIEVAHLARKVYPQVTRVELRNVVDTRLAGQQFFPGFAGRERQGRDRADAGDNHPWGN